MVTAETSFVETVATENVEALQVGDNGTSEGRKGSRPVVDWELLCLVGLHVESLHPLRRHDVRPPLPAIQKPCAEGVREPRRHERVQPRHIHRRVKSHYVAP